MPGTADMGSSGSSAVACGTGDGTRLSPSCETSPAIRRIAGTSGPWPVPLCLILKEEEKTVEEHFPVIFPGGVAVAAIAVGVVPLVGEGDAGFQFGHR